MTKNPPEANHTFCLILVCVGMASVILAGCLGPSNDGGMIDEVPCAYYPDRELLHKKWKPSETANDEGYDSVRIAVGHWGNLEVGQIPDLYVDWSEFPVESRPEVLQDLFCFSLWHVKNSPSLSERFNFGTSVRNEVAVDAMTALQTEHIRQTGQRGLEMPDGDLVCCYVIFQDMVFGVGCHGIHITRHDGSHIMTECTWDP